MMDKLSQLGFALILVMATGSNANAEDSHWTLDNFSFQYDMAVCATVTEEGPVVVNLSDYEIAAFCGSECRGIGTLHVAEKDGLSTAYNYIRIRSNALQDEIISFHIYKKSTRQEMVIQQTYNFESNVLIGTPSNPITLAWKGTLIGDVNGDGDVNIADVACIISYVMGTPAQSFKLEMADVNFDRVVNIDDAITIVNRIIEKMQ